MSNCFNGRAGALSVDGTNVGQLTSWSITQSADAIECTFMGQNWKEHQAGIASWEGSAEALFSGEADSVNSLSSVTPGTVVTIVAYPTDGSAANKFEGSAVVTSIENSASIDDMITATFSFTGTGALTTTLTPAP